MEEWGRPQGIVPLAEMKASHSEGGKRKRRSLSIYLVGASAMSEFTSPFGKEALGCISGFTAQDTGGVKEIFALCLDVLCVHHAAELDA